jgi:peroxiredoxin
LGGPRCIPDRVSLAKGIINLQGEIIESKPQAANDYRLKVDKATLFPVEVVHAIDKDAAIFKTTYAEITGKPTIPSDRSWFFSSYTNEYALKKKSNRVLIEPTKTAPEFTLDAFESSVKVTLGQYKGKLLLLDFWIVNCGFCFQSVAALNELYKKYRGKGLEVVSINMYDPVEAITKFQKKTGPEYTIVTGGDSIAAAYGVDAYPSVVLVGELGKVLYSSKGVDEKELEAAITSNLRINATVGVSIHEPTCRSSAVMIRAILLCIVFASVAQAQWVRQNVDTTAGLRGLSVVNEKIVWVSGTGGTVIRTIDGGKTWKVMTVPGAEKLDFRDVEAFDANNAYILSIGDGESSRIYKTVDGGQDVDRAISQQE